MEALERARARSRDRTVRARELAGEGKEVLGTLCLYPPVELITAAGLVPFRVTGSREPVTDADRCLESLMCPFVRSCFDLAMKSRLNFLTGMIWPHSCDNVQKTFDIWRHYVPSRFFHYLDIPHMTLPSSFEFFEEELENLKRELERFTGREITPQRLAESIDLHNTNRALLRELSGLRRPDPPLLSGSEMLEVILAATSLPVEEANDLVREIIRDVKSRRERPGRRKVRLLVFGAEMDNVEFVRLLEEAGAHVVVEDTCMGTKYYLHDVALEGDPISNLAQRYLGRITCPRTFRFSRGTRKEDLENRFGYLLNLAREYKVHGALLYIIMFCDTFELDVPDVRDFLEEAGVPTLHIEDDYTMSGFGGLRTRVQAFFEMIESPQGNPGRPL